LEIKIFDQYFVPNQLRGKNGVDTGHFE